MTNLDKEKQIATLSSGKKIQYDALISTMPLDITLTWLGKKDWADGLTHRYTHGYPGSTLQSHTVQTPGGHCSVLNRTWLLHCAACITPDGISRRLCCELGCELRHGCSGAFANVTWQAWSLHAQKGLASWGDVCLSVSVLTCSLTVSLLGAWLNRFCFLAC